MIRICSNCKHAKIDVFKHPCSICKHMNSYSDDKCDNKWEKKEENDRQDSEDNWEKKELCVPRT